MVRQSFEAGSITPWVGGGLLLSLNVAASGRVRDAEVDVSDEVSGTDFGLSFEAGAGRGDWDFGLRYVFGLSNVSTSSDADEAVENRGLQLTVAYNLKR